MEKTENLDAAVRMTRVIGGPIERVYGAFLDPEMLRRWYAPESYEVTEVRVDPRVGGRHYTVVTGPDGDRHINSCEIRELVPAERIVMTWVYEGPDAPASESLLTVEFRPVGDRATEVSLVHERLVRAAERESIRAGWASLLDNLDALLAGRDSGDGSR